MKVELRTIDNENRDECVSLKVEAEQSAYVAANEASLAEAAENVDVARPFAIYVDSNMVGFTMFAFDENNHDPSDRYWLWRFMIDASFQGKGYGSAALAEIIRYFKENGAHEITLSTKASNDKALSLYHKFGFRENGQMNDGEIVLKLRVCEELGSQAVEGERR